MIPKTASFPQDFQQDSIDVVFAGFWLTGWRRRSKNLLGNFLEKENTRSQEYVWFFKKKVK